MRVYCFAPRFCATNVESATPSDDKTVFTMFSAFEPTEMAATACAPKLLTAPCKIKEPIAVIESCSAMGIPIESSDRQMALSGL